MKIFLTTLIIAFSIPLTSSLLPSTAVNDPNPVVDSANLFTPAEEENLNTQIGEIDDIKIIVETIPSNPTAQPSKQYARSQASKLGMGETNESKGIYILIIADDREYFVEPTYRVAEIVPQTEFNKIDSTITAPLYEENNYYKGTRNTIEAITQTYENLLLNPPVYVKEVYTTEEKVLMFLVGLGILFIIMVPPFLWTYLDERSKRKAHPLNRELIDNIYATQEAIRIEPLIDNQEFEKAESQEERHILIQNLNPSREKIKNPDFLLTEHIEKHLLKIIIQTKASKNVTVSLLPFQEFLKVNSLIALYDTDMFKETI